MAIETLTGIYIDMGSTNTRVWLMRGLEVLASAQAQVGVADTARDSSTERIREGLKQLIADVRTSRPEEKPSFAIAAGMIGSPLGLAEVPHIPAPAGEAEIAAARQSFQFPDVADLPFLLVPGVRVENDARDQRSPVTGDIMRGEETLCVGLLRGGLLPPGSTLLNLGSHWKAIALDGHGRIASSVTSLSGELIHAACTRTILADSVSEKWPEKLDRAAVAAGIEEQQKCGLPRALFCVRFLAQERSLSPEASFAFLCGAFIGADLRNLLERRLLQPERLVVIAGSPALGSAWQSILEERSIHSILLEEEVRDRALLGALHGFATGGLEEAKAQMPKQDPPSVSKSP